MKNVLENWLKRCTVVGIALLFACAPSITPESKDIAQSERDRIEVKISKAEWEVQMTRNRIPVSGGGMSGGVPYIDLGVATFYIPSNIPALTASEGTITDLNCDDVSGSGFSVFGDDPNGFDGDGDGVGCE